MSKTVDLERTVIGIELGSTRIKSVLIGEDHEVLASGAHDWENRYENGVWTYSLDDIVTGVQGSFGDLARDVKEKYGIDLTTTGALGISAMMHGYIPLDKDGNMLVPFRSWRNTMTAQASTELTELFGFNIPQRWSIAHLYQAILNGEEHVSKIDRFTTLAGYVQWRLTGKHVLGTGEAAGMVPIGPDKSYYDETMLDKFDALIADRGLPWKIRDILPDVMPAGSEAGRLTEEGAAFLDPSGTVKAGFPLCPPEGDAGTGMTATNSVAVRTGNVSAGTSLFSMIVLEKELSRVYPEIDMVTTPTGKPVAMVHCNTCTPEIDAWFGIFKEVLEASGVKVNKPQLYDLMYNSALEGDDECSIVSYGYFAGEPVAEVEEGRPLIMRMPDAKFNFANLMRSLLFSAMATLKLGMDILTEENVKIDRLLGHGGFFKTKEVGQRVTAAALGVPVSVLSTAGEGGAWGMALLAAYSVWNKEGVTLEEYLDSKVFSQFGAIEIAPDKAEQDSFTKYMKRFRDGLAVERIAAENMR